MTKKVLFVVNVDWFFVSHRLPIAERLIEEGYQVHLACTFTDKRQQLQKIGIVCHEIKFSRSGSSFISEALGILSIRKLISSIHFDILHAVTIKPVIYSGLAVQTIFRPVAFVAAISGLGYVFTANTFRARLTKLIVSNLYRLALRYKRKIIIFQNSSDEKILSDIVSLPKSNRKLIKGSGADLSVYDWNPEPDSSRKVVAMACRLLKEKGVYQFVEAAEYVQKQRLDVDFWLIGSIDPENPNSVLQNEIDSWSNKGLIKAFGHREDIPRLFSLSHVVTLPSFYGEGVPKVLIEAAACGRPIVTTNNPGCRDAIIANETGLLVPIKDSESLAKELLKLLGDDELRVSMGHRARQFAVKEFDINNVVIKHLEIYESLIANK